MNAMVQSASEVARTESGTDRNPPDAGMFDLGRLESPPGGWGWTIVPAIVIWLGSVAFLGQYRASEIAEGLRELVGLETVYRVCVGVSVICWLSALGLRKWRLALAWSAAAGFLGGHFLFAELPVHDAVSWRIPFRTLDDGVRFAIHRVVYGLCITLAVVVPVTTTSWLVRRPVAWNFRVGDWSVLGRDFTHRSAPESYARAIIGFAVFAGVLYFVGQCATEFRPMRAGSFQTLWPAVLVAALANAAAEELIFRGAVQPALVASAGLARGLWIGAMMFGLLHWGMSVGVVAALPTSLLIGVGSVFWGKSVLETRGLSWAMVAHAMVDFAIMSAYFVAHR